jgi:RimJ/RimL family protein N-acetyltransferase
MIDRATIEAERLVLQPVEPRLADGIWEATRVSLDELRPWLSWAATASPEQTRTFAQEAARDWEAGTGYNFAVLVDGEVAGTIGLHTPMAGRQIGEIGYWLRADRTGRGYATEAGAAIVTFGFETVRLARLELRAGVENRPSQRVAERLGFQQEGRLRRGCPLPNGGYDCYIYGLLPEDLRAG